MTKKKIRRSSSLRGFHQASIIKEIVSYCDIQSTLFQLRLVCKSWRDAINSLRFDAYIRSVNCGEYYQIWDIAPETFLRRFKCLKVPLNIEKEISGDKIESFLQKTLCHHDLTTLEFYMDVDMGFRDAEIKKLNPFINRMLEYSKKSLREVHLPHLYLPVRLQKLQYLWVTVNSSDTINDVERVLQAIDVNQNIELYIFGLESNRDIARFIAQNMSDSNEKPIMEETKNFDKERGKASTHAKKNPEKGDPKMERRPSFKREEEWSRWPQYIQNLSLLYIILFFPTFIFNLLFSDMTAAGRGTDVFGFLSSQYIVAVACGCIGVLTLTVTYLFDGFKYWTGRAQWRQYAVFAIVAICFVIGGFFAAREYAFSPHAVSLMIMLCYAYLMWVTLLEKWKQPKFLYYMWRALLLMGICLLAFFCAWVFGYDHLWDTENKMRIKDELSKHEFECFYDAETDAVCLQAFLVWFSPFFLSGVYLVFAAVVYFLEAYVTDNTSGNKDLAFRCFLTLIALSAMSVWAAASVAGAGMDLATAVVAFMFSATVWVGVLAVAVVGFDNLYQRFFNVPLVKKLKDSVFGEWFKALFIMCFFWVLLCYFLASCINQKFRECGWTKKKGGYDKRKWRDEFKQQRNSRFMLNGAPATQEIHFEDEEDNSSPTVTDEEDHEAPRVQPGTNTDMIVDDEIADDSDERKDDNSCCHLTKTAHKHFYMLFYWNWTSICLKIVVWGIIYLTFMVFTAKFVTIFLAWLGDVLESWNFGLVIAMFMVIGLTMFLLPPVPGVPVYLTGGIIIPTAAEANGMNFWLGVAIASGICCIVKFLAIVCQQKLIGEMLGSQIWVRRFVGVNSLSIRAIQKILTQKGMKIDKVCILVGGPDWPTSVLTGILHLNLGAMLLGSTPILLLIAPTCVAGAMLKKGAEGGFYAALSGVTLTLAALLQGVALLAAAHYIEKTAFKHEAELMEMKDDVTVKKLDDLSDQFRLLFYKSAQWHELDRWPKVILGAAAVLMILCCFIIQLFDSSCFEVFQLTNKISDPPLNGNPFNLFKPLGIFATVLFFLSVILWWGFYKWAYGNLARDSKEFEKLNKLKLQLLGKEVPPELDDKPDIKRSVPGLGQNPKQSAPIHSPPLKAMKAPEY